MTARNSEYRIGGSMAVLRDAALIVVIAVAAAVICVRLDLSEALLSWTRQHERMQLDELPAVLLVVAVCLIWFSARRYYEARAQLRLRMTIEARLVDALAGHQRLAQQYVDMQEYERKALARDLHDELGQYLNVIKLDAVSIRDGGERHHAAIDAAARAVIDNVDRVYAVVSNLIRQLRPVGFDELGLGAALEHWIGDWRARLPGSHIELAVEPGMDGLGEARALTVFRLVQEALTNVTRHAAASQVEVRVERRAAPLHGGEPEECVLVHVSDNGRGTDLNLPQTGLGLVGMRERVAAFGGIFDVISSPGQGFAVRARMPVN